MISMTMINFDVGVILPSAGTGDRFGGSIPKQYCKIMGQPLFLYALQEFLAVPWVKKIALVVDNPDYVRGLIEESYCNKDKITIIRGEHTRHRSIRAGVLEILREEPNLQVLVVHDAVRPFVPVTFLEELVLAADEYGASGATRPLVSTVIQPDGKGFVRECLNRSQYVASETPQAFQSSVLSRAFSKCSEEDLDTGTECLQLALSYAGVHARLVTGPNDLWKVTYKKDIYAASCCIRERVNKVCVVAAEESTAVPLIVDALQNSVTAVHRVLTASAIQPDSKQTFNTIIFFHSHEINPDRQLLDLAGVVDVNKEGLIVHVIEHTSTEGMQSLSVYDLHHNGCTMAHQYQKLHKGVVIIHCLAAGEEQRLVKLVLALVTADSSVFSGQTFFL